MLTEGQSLDEVRAYLRQLYPSRTKELFGQLKKQTQTYKKVQPAFDALAAHLPRIQV